MALTAKKVYAILKRQISDMEAKLNSPVRYRGTVATADLLPLNPDIGDMYNIESKSVYGEAGMNVAWTGEIWDTLGPAIDMAPYLREDSEIITSLKTKTENLESANYTDRGTLADTDAFLINDGTGMKKSVLSKLSDFVLNKIADKVFAKLQTNDKTILGAINELNSKTFMPIKFLMCSDQTLDLINNPTKLFDKQFQDTKSAIAYGILFNDNAGTSIFGGGVSFIIGYTYLSDNYGSQLVIKYNTLGLKIRCKIEGAWGELLNIK